MKIILKSNLFYENEEINKREFLLLSTFIGLLIIINLK